MISFFSASETGRVSSSARISSCASARLSFAFCQADVAASTTGMMTFFTAFATLFTFEITVLTTVSPTKALATFLMPLPIVLTTFFTELPMEDNTLLRLLACNPSASIKLIGLLKVNRYALKE